jgi:hypothetical protein
MTWWETLSAGCGHMMSKPTYYKKVPIKPHATGFEIFKHKTGGDLIDIHLGGLEVVLDLSEARELAHGIFGAITRAEEDIKDREDGLSW